MEWWVWPVAALPMLVGIVLWIAAEMYYVRRSRFVPVRVGVAIVSLVVALATIAFIVAARSGA